MILPKPPGCAAGILKKLSDNGHASYLVGGCVRDAVMGRAPRDWDIATSARTHEVAALFDKTAMTGEKYGTVNVITPEGTVEVTTFRADGEYTDNRRPDSVIFGTSIETDLTRRDFTVNAIAMNEHGELLDMFGGLDDIKKRVIRCVGDPETRFKEDALRMLRGLRLSAELGFSIDPDTAAAIKKLSGLAEKLSAERVCTELERTLMSDNPDTAFEMLSAGLLKRYIPDISDVSGAGLTKLPAVRSMRWSGFCAALIVSGSKISTADLLTALRIDGKIKSVCTAAMRITKTGFPESRFELKKLIASNGAEAVKAAAAADCAISGSGAVERTLEILHSGECISLSTLAVTGRDIINAGLKEGAEVGKALNALLGIVLERPELNNTAMLLDELEKLKDVIARSSKDSSGT